MKRSSKKHSTHPAVHPAHVWTVGEVQMLKFINDFLKASLANLVRQQRNEAILDIGESAKHFAVQTVKRELKARGIDFNDAIKDHSQVLHVVLQLFGYTQAILRRTIYFLKKECPDVAHQDSGISEAATVGLMLRNIQIDDPAVRAYQEKENISKAAKLAFDKAISRKSPARWKYPKLDLWLILVWPLVEIEKWNYATVHHLASQKSFEGIPMNSAAALSAHCKLTLGLKIRNEKAGRPKNNTFNLEDLHPLHKFAIEIDSGIPEYFFPNK